ncbi:hypothetical protein NSQ59_04660 [Margalitia sp. FSL K6-0131]|uniref:hypothetical protein n=1 Tax=Margalitia sp. FSL K6-0131 TaxID=2954604 RepID=UPI0030FB1124
MIKMWLVLLLLLTLSGCSAPHAVIEWVDFIKWDGKMYDGIGTGVLADEKYLGKKVGEVKFKVSDNVNDPYYKMKDGDAAFHQKGTPIYAIKGNPQFLAVKDSDMVHGYHMYSVQTKNDSSWHFKDMPLDKVNRIEIYERYTSNGTKSINEIKDHRKIQQFLSILKNSREQSNYNPNTEKGDPIFYEMVFYTDEPIAYKFWLQYDRVHYFWAPWDTNVLSNEIGKFIMD